jgi:hypothetical protein
MGYSRSTYIGPYAIGTIKKSTYTYQNLACPNEECKANKNTSQYQIINFNFCPMCGSKMEMQNFEAQCCHNLDTIFEKAKIKTERLIEMHPDWIDVKKEERAFVTNVKFEHSKHISSDQDSMILDLTKNSSYETAIQKFKDFFKLELTLIEQNFGDVSYGYGLLIWYS